MIGPTCGTCKFSDVGIDLEEQVARFCRRFPPHAQGDRTMWTRVEEFDWCGEYQATETPA